MLSNIFKAEQIREDDLEGIREHTTKQITTLEEKIVGLQVESQRQDEIIENKLRSVIPFYISSENRIQYISKELIIGYFKNRGIFVAASTCRHGSIKYSWG